MPGVALDSIREGRGWPGGEDVSIRQRLRTATADAHARIDKCFGLLDLTEAGDYRRFLEVSASALLPLEAALTEVEAERILPDWAARMRTRAILADLAKLHGLAKPVRVTKPSDLGAMLGTLYVLEGSRLGARVLTGIVERSPDQDVRAATAYLRHGEQLRLWPSFLTRLEHFAARLKSDESAIEGALAAFDAFERAAVGLQGNRATHVLEAVRA
jgi:heme oxygenase